MDYVPESLQRGQQLVMTIRCSPKQVQPLRSMYRVIREKPHLVEMPKVKELHGGTILQDDDEDVKIQGYTVIPDSRPEAGLFETCKGDDLEVTVPDYPFYVIHLDVLVPDPNFGP